MSQIFDYIVVGGGTAGLTVASRLSEDPDVNILVIEAGANNSNDPEIRTPGLLGGIYGNPKYDWNFLSVPQAERNNRVLPQPRGKLLGGSSAINFMMLVYPDRGSLDAWAALGNKGWGYDTLKPYFQKFATVHPPQQAAKDVSGLDYHDSSVVGDGPIQISFSDGYPQANKFWKESLAKQGLEVTSDPREGKALGAFQQPASIDPATKTRSDSATGYYSPAVASRKNLTIITQSAVKRIIFDHSGAEPVARGVVAVSDEGTETIHRGSEVILAAGSLMTPQILELSGVGSKDLLLAHGISVVVDNPNVGEHLQDHTLTCQSFEVSPDTTSQDMIRDPAVLQAALAQYQATREGPLGQSNYAVAYVPLADKDGVFSARDSKEFFAANEEHITTEEHMLVRSLLETGQAPAVEYMLFHQQLNTVHPGPQNLLDFLLPARPENYLSILTMVNHPFSRGNIHIQSANIRDLPRYDPGFGSNPLDIEISARHSRFVETILQTEPFTQLLKHDGARVPDLKGDTLENAKEIVRQCETTVFHPSGSCRMLPKEKGGVVDDRLKVYGVKGLRVVDASVFPLEPSGNIQTTVYAVAERAADLVKEDRMLSKIPGRL